MTLCLRESGCGACGKALPPRRQRWCSDKCRTGWYVNHLWRRARREAMRRAKRRCLACHKPAREVDHIVARMGVPIHKPSCLHHQANLRALCHYCHVNRKAVFNEGPIAA